MERFVHHVKNAQHRPVTQRTVYISPQWLEGALAGEIPGYEDTLVLEVGYARRQNAPGYLGITELEDETGSAEGLYNLLDPDIICRNLLRHGITSDTKLILYGEDFCGTARAAYACLYEGVKDVKILEGGARAWESVRRNLQEKMPDARSQLPQITTESFGSSVPADPDKDFGCPVPAHPEYCLSLADVLRRMKEDSSFRLVSVRTREEWLGQGTGYSYVGVSGEPEGAVWAGNLSETSQDMNGLVHEDGTVLSEEELREQWRDAAFSMDHDFPAFYCGTGWRASVPFLLLYQSGHENMAVYDGGWLEWSLHPELPVQIGDPREEKKSEMDRK